MKKTVKLLLGITMIVAMLVSFYPKSYAKEVPTLGDIVNLFNVCKSIKKDNQVPNLNVVASTQGSDIRVRVSVRTSDDPTIPLQVTNLDYSYDSISRVLTGEYVGGDTDIRDYWIKYSKILIDCIEQFHGYAEGEFFDTLNTTQVANYTLADEGLRIETNSPSRFYTQINIATVIPTLDVNTYVKEEDLTDLANNIKGDGIAKFKKGNIVFYKYTVNDKDILTIGELGDFTYKIDKSILTVLKVMFGTNAPVDYFKTNYPSVDSDKNFAGYTVEVNPIKSDVEQHVFSDDQSDQSYKFVRITIDRNAVLEALNPKQTVKETPTTTPVTETPTTGETPVTTQPVTTTTTTTSGTNNSGKLPNTGKEINWGVMSLYGVFSIALLGIILVSLNKKKENS